MDSVVVFFGNATFEEVEREASVLGLLDGTVTRGSESFHLWRYPAEAMHTEYEAAELESLLRSLGTEVKSAFQVACRHGANARLAIQVVSSLMSKFKPSVLDDDFGGLWLPEQVAACAESLSEQGIYALRSDA